MDSLAGFSSWKGGKSREMEKQESSGVFNSVLLDGDSNFSGGSGKTRTCLCDLEKRGTISPPCYITLPTPSEGNRTRQRAQLCSWNEHVPRLWPPTYPEWHLRAAGHHVRAIPLMIRVS